MKSCLPAAPKTAPPLPSTPSTVAPVQDGETTAVDVDDVEVPEQDESVRRWDDGDEEERCEHAPTS